MSSKRSSLASSSQGSTKSENIGTGNSLVARCGYTGRRYWTRSSPSWLWFLPVQTLGLVKPDRLQPLWSNPSWSAAGPNSIVWVSINFLPLRPASSLSSPDVLSLNRVISLYNPKKLFPEREVTLSAM